MLAHDRRIYCISYNAIGNPTNWYNGNTYTNLTWRNGRQLSSITANNKTYEYEYDVNGLRTRKTNADGGYTQYYIIDGLTVAEQRFNADGTERYTLRYLYDQNNLPVGFGLQYPTAPDSYWDNYYLAKNLQGDVIGVYYGTTCVASYTYDPYGNPTGAYDKNGVAIDPAAAHVGNYNPFRYRGYFYDADTGFYYLQSRYYDPQVGRFLNADAFAGTGQSFLGYNMFAYCNNNPVNRKDPTGQFWTAALIVTAVFAVCTVALSGCSSRITSNVGAASPYSPSNSLNYNCYAYALGEDKWKYVGGYLGAVEDFDVDNVAGMVLDDALKDGRAMRIIDSYDSPIDSNEYRIALRTGEKDYHFMVQHDDGSWSHKPGFCSTRLIDGANPSVIWWDAPIVDRFLLQNFGIVKEIGSMPNYYDSRTIYFAVSK